MKKPATRKAMVEYLSGHFRYHTMNSWNLATSYAVKIKVHTVVPREDQDAVYLMLDVEDSFDESGYNSILRAFDERHHHFYQIGSNGRSGGYLVLYQGGTTPSEHKSQCRICGQRNFQQADPEPGKCGRCGAIARYNRQFPPDVFTNPGKGLDDDTDFKDKSEWSAQALRNRVDLVWDFDQTCAEAVKAYIAYAKENRVIEKIIRVPKKIKVSVPRRGGRNA